MNAPIAHPADLPDYLPISMLNQLAYCERRFWLMYVCGEMEINAPVLEGIHQHERVHSAGSARDGTTVTHRRVYLWSDRLRIAGFADLVEECRVADGVDRPRALSLGCESDAGDLPWFSEEDETSVQRPSRRNLMPIEYKHGRKGRWQNDRIQLCAQAICLEERTGQVVEKGQIFYWRSRRRVDVAFTPELRAQTEATVAQAFALLDTGRMPPPLEQRAKCRDCSLEGICLPREVLLLSQG